MSGIPQQEKTTNLLLTYLVVGVFFVNILM